MVWFFQVVQNMFKTKIETLNSYRTVEVGLTSSGYLYLSELSINLITG